MLRPSSKKRRFYRFLLWNTVGGIGLGLLMWPVLDQPLGARIALLVTVSFVALMLIMGAVLAAYFAFLRT